jgi:hypothetical protein
LQVRILRLNRQPYRSLRVALGDNPSEPRFIRTLLRFGYAFCGETLVGAVSPPDDGPRWAALWSGREVPLPNGKHLIGRGEECRIRSHSSRVSRHHARVRVTPESGQLSERTVRSAPSRVIRSAVGWPFAGSSGEPYTSTRIRPDESITRTGPVTLSIASEY